MEATAAAASAELQSEALANELSASMDALRQKLAPQMQELVTSCTDATEAEVERAARAVCSAAAVKGKLRASEKHLAEDSDAPEKHLLKQASRRPDACQSRVLGVSCKADSRLVNFVAALGGA